MRAARRCIADPCDTEVEDLDLSLAADKEVRWLDVTMHDALRMRGGEGVEQLMGDAEDVGDSESAALHRRELLHRESFEQLHHEESRPVLCHVVVEDVDGAGVLYRVGGIALAQEPGANVFAERELRVEQLDGELLLVAVRRCIDRRHAANPEHAIETVLPPEHLPEALLGAQVIVIVLVRLRHPGSSIRSRQVG